MKCLLCSKYKDNITSSKNFNASFIDGSDKFRLSTVSAHHASECIGRQASWRRGQKQKKQEKSKMTQTGKTLIGESLKNAGKLNNLDRAYLEKLFHVIAKKDRPYTDFQDHIELEKLHGVNFSTTGSYENETACRNFINFSSKCIFDKSLKEKLLRVNFVSVLCDGSTDTAVVEKSAFTSCTLIHTLTDQHLRSFRYKKLHHKTHQEYTKRSSQHLPRMDWKMFWTS